MSTFDRPGGVSMRAATFEDTAASAVCDSFALLTRSSLSFQAVGRSENPGGSMYQCGGIPTRHLFFFIIVIFSISYHKD